MKKLGLIINPIAGMGGSVGLKGTDYVVLEALKRGAVPRAGERTELALSELIFYREQIVIYTRPGEMGGDLAKKLGFSTVFVTTKEQGKEQCDADRQCNTSQNDTLELAKCLVLEKVDLILFAGGDGTARDIYKAVALQIACVGIPAGVKIHSPVYAKNPRAAGNLAAMWLMEKIKNTAEEEVLDIDEELYRQEIISTRLYGYLAIPKEKSLTQNRKSPTPLSETASIESIAYEVTDNMEQDICYLIGAGTTTRGIMQMLGLKNTLIGVDLLCNKRLEASDIYGEEIIKRIKGRKTKLVVTITGGQGFLFGRGNQQITPEVIRAVGKENIIILATKAKLASLGGRALLVDTFDEELNRELCGYYRAVTGYGEFTMCKVSDN